MQYKVVIPVRITLGANEVYSAPVAQGEPLWVDRDGERQQQMLKALPITNGRDAPIEVLVEAASEEEALRRFTGAPSSLVATNGRVSEVPVGAFWGAQS